MNCLHFFALAIEEALDLHEATGIVGDNVVGAGLEGGAAFHFTHGGGNHGVFDSKGAAEAATYFRVLHFDELNAANLCEKFAGCLFVTEFTEAMTAVVKGDFAGKPGAHISYTEFFH